MEVRASVKYIRISPRKVRLIADLIRGLPVEAAEHQLMVVPRRSCPLFLKLLNSAIANAKNTYNIKKENLYIKIIKVDSGPSLKRWMPKAMGRATPIMKRSSRIVIILDELKDTGKKKIKKVKKEEKPVVLDEKPQEGIIGTVEDIKGGTFRDEESSVKNIFDKTREGKHRSKQNLDKLRSKGKFGLIKKIFRRKTI